MSGYNGPHQQRRSANPGAPPGAARKAHIRAVQAQHSNGQVNSSDQPSQKAQGSRGSILGRLTVSEWLTFFVGLGTLLVALGSLSVAYQTYEASRDTRDIKRAIGNLANLAQQTKRQADNSDRQVAILSGQADDQRRQTAAIQSQTVAIGKSSAATIVSAQAQGVAANTAMRAQAPILALNTLSVSGFSNAADSEGNVTLTVNWSFRNQGGPATIRRVGIQFQIGKTIPELMPNFPMEMITNDATITSAINEDFATREPSTTVFKKQFIEAVNNGQASIWFFARVEYTDLSNVLHTSCFGYKIIVKGSEGSRFVRAGGPSYHCRI